MSRPPEREIRSCVRCQGQERTQELPRVLDYTAAPFGTKEWELQNFGVEGSR
ncbi:hypothetical protein [Actinoplanes sp. NPDC049802]|uniref:hypothetical protein n=1 Tax=Actinoplanes sp. NPDC049802 TaxID=3154742 RepID=UPI0033C77FD9